jgi:electron transport complex protein RnfB
MIKTAAPAASQTEMADALDAWLPQTQCTQCGYPRCRAYAQALVRGEADLNQCPPGGDVTIRALAELLGRTPMPLNPAHGVHKARALAVIDEQTCIGCRKCLDACPVDAILGARKLMHTVLSAECNGCGLCLPPCPVDCIALVPVNFASETANAPFLARAPRLDPFGDRWPEYSLEETARWRAHTERRLARLTRRPLPASRLSRHSHPPVQRSTETRASIFPDRATIRADIRAALERARTKNRSRGST